MMKTAFFQIGMTYAPYALHLVGLVVLALAGLAYKKLSTKWHFELSATQLDMVETILGRGVAYAEQWASKRTAAGVKPTGNAKLDAALAMAKSEMAAHGLPAMAEERLKQLLEAKLGVDKVWLQGAVPMDLAPGTTTSAT